MYYLVIKQKGQVWLACNDEIEKAMAIEFDEVSDVVMYAKLCDKHVRDNLNMADILTAPLSIAVTLHNPQILFLPKHIIPELFMLERRVFDVGTEQFDFAATQVSHGILRYKVTSLFEAYDRSLKNGDWHYI